MIHTKILDTIAHHIHEVLEAKTEKSHQLIEQLNLAHYADIAQLINHLQASLGERLFMMLKPSLKVLVFYELQPQLMRNILSRLSISDKSNLLKESHADAMTDFFDVLTDEELQGCLDVLHQKDRQQVLSLMKFAPDTAGGIMNVDVITLTQDFTVAKSVTLLQRLRPQRDLYRNIYVTDTHNKLVGVIKLEDLILKRPETRLKDILRQVPFTATVYQDQEEIAKKMAHYRVTTAPVVNNENFLLGIITGETLVDVLQQEAQEDVQKMSGFLSETSYLESSVFSIVMKRGMFLAFLLLVESLTSLIMDSFHGTLSAFLFSFITMLVSTGGNTSSQTSAIVIQGLSSGDINETNTYGFLRREFLIGSVLALFLSVIAFGRIYVLHQDFLGTLVVSLSLGMIVFMSVVFGSVLPIILKRFDIDPAFFAGPFLATIMDIIGILVYCYIAYLILY